MPVMKLSKYIKVYPCSEKPGYFLLFSTKRLSKILVPASLLKAAENGSLPADSEQTLLRLGFLVEDPVAERERMVEGMEDLNRNSKTFNAVVVLNLDCNLACRYCFEGSRKGKHYMSAETGDRLVDFVSEKYIGEGKDIRIDFYGGEPLLSLELIKDISGRLNRVSGYAGVKYSFTLVTNGTLLTRRVVDELLPLGLKGAKITLDGPKENHDIYRPFISGEGSFDVILRNMREVCDVIKVQTGGNFTRDNYRQFPRLLDLFMTEGLTPGRLDLVTFAPVTTVLGECTVAEFSEGCSSLDEPWLVEAGVFLREEIMRRGYRTPKTGPCLCVIESRDFVAVNYDGKLYKCPGFIGYERMAVGDINTGIADYTASHNLDVWKTDDCLDCAYLPLCFGGCRFLKLLNDGAIDGVQCRKNFLDSCLERFLMQDLKYTPTKKSPDPQHISSVSTSAPQDTR